MPSKTFIKILIFVILILGISFYFLKNSENNRSLAQKEIIPENKTTTEENSISKNITIGWVGDIVPSMIKDNTDNYPDIFSNVKENISQPDLMIGNLEGTLANTDTNSKCKVITTNCFAFRGPSSFAKNLKDAGFDFISLENNHAFDYEAQGYADTKKALDDISLPHSLDNGNISTIKINGKNIGIVGFSSYLWTNDFNQNDIVKNLVAKSKKENDITIVIFHGGAEGVNKNHVLQGTEYYLNENRGDLRAFAHSAIDNGADLVLGSGPHVLRGMEFYKDKLIAYSLGNFAGYKTPVKTKGALGTSAILSVTLSPLGIFQTGTITPITVSDDGIPNLNNPDTLSTIQSLSTTDFPATYAKISDTGEIKEY